MVGSCALQLHRSSRHEFYSVAHGNAQLAELFTTIAHERPHPPWPERRVVDIFEEERPRLLALPDVMPETCSVTPVSVDKSAFVRLDTNRYSWRSSASSEEMP